MVHCPKPMRKPPARPAPSLPGPSHRPGSAIKTDVSSLSMDCASERTNPPRPARACAGWVNVFGLRLSATSRWDGAGDRCDRNWWAVDLPARAYARPAGRALNNQRADECGLFSGAFLIGTVKPERSPRDPG